MNKFISLVFVLSATSVLCAKVKYINSKKTNHSDTYFGVTVKDPYQWLEDDQSAQTKEWVAQQNIVTQKFLKKITYRDQIHQRLIELTDYIKTYSFFKAGEKMIYLKNTGLQNQSVWMYKTGNSEEKILLDPNQFDSAGTTAFSFLEYNEELNLIGVAVNKAGSDWTTLKVFDLNTLEFTDDELKWSKFSNTKWYKDGFYYNKFPTPESGAELSASSEFQSVYYHKIGTPQEQDILIYFDEDNPKLYYNLDITEDKQYQILYRKSGTDGFEVLYRKQNEEVKDDSPFQYLFRGYGNKNYIIDHQNGSLTVLTDVDAPNYRLVKIDLNQPDKSNWETILAETGSVIKSAQPAGGKLIVSYLENAHSVLKVFDQDGRFEQEISLPGLGTAGISYAKNKDNEFFLTFTSFTSPSSNYSYDLTSNQLTTLAESVTRFNSSDFESSQVWYSSKDGTRIPMFIIHKKGLEKNNDNPAFLYAYGGFNVSLTPTFSTSYIALLEQGAVIAIPNLRGGGEFGEEWHQAGMRMNKQNVFDDFIAAAEFLIAEGYTSSKKLAIAGGSNGGLLVGACMTQRPELFRVAFPAVGVMDMLKYQNFTVGWGWVPEYGSSEQSQEMFEYLYAYSPYHNIRKGVNYPATMVTTADHDDRVVPAHSFKFAARLQEYTKNKYPALIRIDTDAGHGAGKPISKILDEVADKWGFFLWNTGVRKLK